MQRIIRPILIIVIVIMLLLPAFYPQDMRSETLPEYTKRASDTFHSMQAEILEEKSYTWEQIHKMNADEIKEIIFED